MDTSEQYINMCRKAKELQEMWKPTQGDWFVLYAEIETIGDYSEDLHPIDYREEFPISKKNCVWLPRIDQILQHISEIPQWTHYKSYELMYKVLDYYSNYFTRGKDSYEQSFVQILYSEKYNKSWNGEDWTCTSNTTA